MNFRSLLIAILLTAANFGFAADIPIEQSEIYKEIDVHLMSDTVKALREYKGATLGAIVGGVTNKPEAFAPPVLYQLSSVLFEQGKKDEAVFWFHAGQLRGLIDANICADRSALASIDALNQRFGPPIKQYSLTNISVFSNTVERVVAWEAETPCKYDRRWINLAGRNAIIGETNSALSAPPEQWEEIRKRTREKYASDFHRALGQFTQQKN